MKADLGRRGRNVLVITVLVLICAPSVVGGLLELRRLSEQPGTVLAVVDPEHLTSEDLPSRPYLAVLMRVEGVDLEKRLLTGYAQARVILTSNEKQDAAWSNGTDYRFEVPIGESGLVLEDGGGVDDSPSFALPLTGGSFNFPEDRYRADVASASGLSAEAVAATGSSRTIPVALKFVADPRFNAWTGRSTPLVSIDELGGRLFSDYFYDPTMHIESNPFPPPAIGFEIMRPAGQRWFIWGMLAVPFVPVTAFAVRRVAERAKVDAAEDPTSPLEYAVALFALVALREIFVPDDIRGLTTFDYLLGFEAALATVVMIGFYWFARSDGGTKPPTPALNLSLVVGPVRTGGLFPRLHAWLYGPDTERREPDRQNDRFRGE